MARIYPEDKIRSVISNTMGFDAAI